MGLVTETQARGIVTRMCRKFIEDEPARGETEIETERRTSQLELEISAQIGHLIRPTSLDDILTTLAEVQSVECGTHLDVDQNQALTINTAPDILDRLESQLREDLYFVLQAAGFTPRRHAA